MYVDDKVVQYAAALCAAAELGPDHAAKLVEAAKQVATAQQRSWISPNDVKVALRTYPHGKAEAVIAHALDFTEVP
jgi:histone H3/H4